MKINSKIFNFGFFLSNRVKVDSLENGTLKHGGATYIEDSKDLYSNVEGSEFIEILRDNKISIFIPDTINVSESIDNSKQVEYIVNRIYSKYGKVNNIQKAKGAWFSDDLNKVVYDNITIVSINHKRVTKKDIRFFIKLAEYVKKEMTQEGVTLTINSAMCIV